MDNSLYTFSFEDFRIVSINFDLKTVKQSKPTRKSVDVATTLSLRVEHSQDNKELLLFMGINVCGEKLPFSLGIESRSVFAFSAMIEDIPSLKKVANINCAAIVYPYLRETAADIVRRAGLPQLNLPPVNFVELYRAQVESEPKSKAKIKKLN
jgi:preprotein translocase subunit SecB